MSNVRSPGSQPAADQSSWWGPHAPAAESLSVVQLIRAGTLDAELAALAWLLIEGRVPLLVASGPQQAGKTTVLTALLEFVSPSAVTRRLRGWDEDFAWLPEATRLGWRPEGGARSAGSTDAGRGRARPNITPDNGYLIAGELSPHLPEYTWGEQARIAIRAVALGYGLGATIHADSLQEILDELRGPDIRMTDDELSNLGLVLILRAFRGAGRNVVRRVVAAHYVRPVSRDAGGHIQRLGPAVLATWNQQSDTFEHFGWGVIRELARRVGRRAGDFEAELDRRRDVLLALAAAGIESLHDVRAAIEGDRLASTNHRN